MYFIYWYCQACWKSNIKYVIESAGCLDLDSNQIRIQTIESNVNQSNAQVLKLFRIEYAKVAVQLYSQP